MDIEVLHNSTTDRYFLLNKDTGVKGNINYAALETILKIFKGIKKVSFTNIKSINQYIKDCNMIKKGEVPKPTPDCHKFFADE